MRHISAPLFDPYKIGKSKDEFRLGQRSFQREAALAKAIGIIADELTGELDPLSLSENDRLLEHSGFGVD